MAGGETLLTIVDVEVDRPWLRQYPDGVPATIDYPDSSIGDVLEDVCRRHGDAEAIVFQGCVLTWKDIHSYSNRLAGSLKASGVGKGDRVAVLLPNLPQFVVAYYAIVKLGAIIVATSPLLSDPEIARHVAVTKPRVLITLDVFYPRVSESLQEMGVSRLLVCNVLDFMPLRIRFLAGVIHQVDSWLKEPRVARIAANKALSSAGERILSRSESLKRLREAPKPERPVRLTSEVRSFMKEMHRYPDVSPTTKVSPGDVAALLYTTGTTGTPKAAKLTHRNLLANAYQMRHWFPELVDGRETIMAVLPFFHAYGLTLVMNAGLVLAARSVLIPRPNLTEIFEVIRRFKPTALPGVPALFISIVNSERSKTSDLRSIRVCVSGGAPLPLEVKERFDSLTGGHLYEGYGLTEASPLTHAHPSNQSAPAGSIGLPVADTEAKIVDEEGDPVRQGEPGELLVRGPQIMAGYWEEQEETDRVLRNGWLHTGDIARMDEEGYFFIVDRKKDLIITGGENIAPREIEEALYRHPKILEVAVAGVPHRYGGEVAKAWIVPQPGETLTKSEVLKWLDGKLAHYKIPRAVEFRDALPKSPMGKVLRRPLVEEDAVKREMRTASKASESDSQQ